MGKFHTGTFAASFFSDVRRPAAATLRSLRMRFLAALIVMTLLITSPLRADEPPTKFDIYCWTPFVDAPDNLIGVTFVNGQGNPTLEARRVAPALLRLPVRMRIVEPWNPCNHMVPPTPREYLVNGLGTRRVRQWYADFFAELHAQGVTEIQHLLQDDENNASVWHYKFGQNPAAVVALWNDPIVRARMRPELARLTVRNADAINPATPSGREFYQVWNTQTDADVQAAHLAAINDAPEKPKIHAMCNFDRMGFGVVTTDQNGWQNRGNWPAAAPVCYFAAPDAVPGPMRSLKKDYRWNQLIHQVNQIRANRAAGFEVYPWIAWPESSAGGGVELWKLMLRVIAAENPAAFLWWQPDWGKQLFPGELFGQRQRTRSLSASAEFIANLTRPTTIAPTDQIPFNAAEINGVQYDDFRRAIGDGAMK